MRLLNIGCGQPSARFPGDIGIDMDPGARPDILASAESLPIRSSSVDEIMASHVLEHVNNIVAVMNECWRVLKPSGRISISVPKFPTVAAIADPTHRRYFVPETFDYFRTPGKLSGLHHPFVIESLQTSSWEILCKLRKS